MYSVAFCCHSEGIYVKKPLLSPGTLATVAQRTPYQCCCVAKDKYKDQTGESSTSLERTIESAESAELVNPRLMKEE